MKRACAIVFAIAGLGLVPACEETPEAKSPGAEVGAKRRHDRFEAKLTAAKKALSNGKADDARELADDARELADQTDMMTLHEFVGEIDRHEGTVVAENAADKAAGGNCAAAVEMVSVAAQRIPRPRFLVPLRQVSEPAITECLEKEIDRAIAKGDFDAARTIVERTPTKVALGGAARKKLAERVHDGIVRYVARHAEVDAKEGRYDEAAGKIEEAINQGVLSAEDEPAAFAIIQAAALPRQIEALTAAVGSKKKPEVPLAALDAVAKTMRWTELPADLVKARTALGTWIECLKLRCATPKPEARFTHGKLAVSPGVASTAAPTTTLAPAKKLWIVARAGKLVLLADQEIQAGATVKDRVFAAVGWAPEDALKREDTTDWLPPGDDLKGQRVFGPLREQAKLLYLGFVMDVDGDDAKIKRIGEDQILTLPRNSLRIGRLAKGQKVLAACPGQSDRTVATVDHEVPPRLGTMPQVNLVCPGADGGAGYAYDEFIGAIAVEPDWVPAGEAGAKKGAAR